MQVFKIRQLRRSTLILPTVLFIAIFCVIPTARAAGEKILKVGFSIYSPPVFLEEENNFTAHGISVDIGQMIADSMNSSVQFYAMDDLGLTEALNKDTVDIVIGIKNDFENPETLNMIETNIRVTRRFFVNDKCLDFDSLKDLPGHTVILRGGNFVARLLTSRRDISFIEVESTEEGLSLLNSGKAQVYVSHSSALDLSTIREKGFYNIIEAGSSIINAPLVIATHKNNSGLFAALRTAYAKSLNTYRYNRIVNVWMHRDIHFVDLDNALFRSFFAYYARYILLAIALIVFALLAILFWNSTLKRKVQKINRDLQISEQKYKDLIESSPDMIHLVSLDGNIILSNKIALHSLGRIGSETAVFRFHDLVVPDQIEAVDSFLQRVSKENFFKGEFTFKTESGENIHVEMVATMVRWAHDEEGLVCCFSRDLNERKRLEENLLYSERLAVMGQMTAGIAHEINNPLGIILTNAEEVLNHELNAEDLRENLKSIERNALRAGKIIEDLLSFTRPSPLDKTPIDLTQLIDESLFFLKHRIKKKHINIEKRYASSPVVFHGDEKLIQQLLINLILNAIQAVRQDGRITLTVKTIGENGNGKVHFEVEDNGVGIRDEDINRIFDPFFTVRKEGGFGLGLFMSKIIIEKHRGNISINSKISTGTVVAVDFPVLEVAETAAVRKP